MCVCVCVCVCVFCVEENQERSAGIEWRLYMVPALAFEYLSPIFITAGLRGLWAIHACVKSMQFLCVV